MNRSARTSARRPPRQPLLTRPGVRRTLIHLFCLGLVCLAAIGPLASLSGISSRRDVAGAVTRHARYLVAQEEAAAGGGWNAPSYPLTISEVAAANPPEPALPWAPSNITQPAPAADAPPATEPDASGSGPTSAGMVPVAPDPIREAARQELREAFANLPEGYGFVVLDAAGAVVFEHRATEQFQAASLYKLGVAAEVFRLKKAGVLSFSDPLIVTRESLADGDTLFAAGDVGRKITVGEAVDFMITRSSNVAAILLMKKVGPSGVNRMFGDLGMPETKLLDRPFRNIYGNAKNQTTPRDIAHFFWLLLREKVVDADSSRAIITLLLRQRIEDRLPASLPKGTPVAHKTGNLVGVVHDAGILYTRNGPVVVVGMSQDGPTEEEAINAIAQLGRVTYDSYHGVPAAGAEE
jgi:beta-lactamase class A